MITLKVMLRLIHIMGNSHILTTQKEKNIENVTVYIDKNIPILYNVCRN